jgi:hypothetical protein
MESLIITAKLALASIPNKEEGVNVMYNVLGSKSLAQRVCTKFSTKPNIWLARLMKCFRTPVIDELTSSAN